MGSSASILSPEDFMLMSQDMKVGFETLIEEGYTDDEIRSSLMDKYAKHLEARAAVADSSAEAETAAIVSLDGTSADDECDEVDLSTASGSDAVAVAIVENNNNQEIIEPKPPLTEKAKKARKRRGTFENDKVVTSKAANDVLPKVDKPVGTIVE